MRKFPQKSQSAKILKLIADVHLKKGAVFAERFREHYVINLVDQFFEKVMQIGLMNHQKHSNNVETLTILQKN